MSTADQRITLWSAKSDNHSVLQVITECIPIEQQLDKIKQKQSKHSKKSKSRLVKNYNPDIHCGVLDSNEEPCMNVITCVNHNIYEKQEVLGRSKHLRTAIKDYQKEATSKISKRKYQSGKKYNPNKHCGVRDSKGYPCMRIITCTVHTIAEKKKVRRRRKNVKALLKEYKAQKPKKSNTSKNIVRVDIEQLLGEDTKNDNDMAMDISDILGKYAILIITKK